MSDGHSANVEWIIANAINEQARGDPSALAPHIIAALEKAGYRITPATEDTALGSQPFEELTPDMRPHDVHGLREPGSTWSRAIWSAIPQPPTRRYLQEVTRIEVTRLDSFVLARKRL